MCQARRQGAETGGFCWVKVNMNQSKGTPASMNPFSTHMSLAPLNRGSPLGSHADVPIDVLANVLGDGGRVAVAV